LTAKRTRIRAAQPRGAIRRFFSILGPGLITGAADDDPSGIATYSIAGAQLGTSLLWTAFLTWPLMAAVQLACARIGMVTGAGLASAFRKKSPRGLLVAVALALFAANTINIAADLSGMADAAQMLCGLNSYIFVVVFGLAIGAATIWLRYQQIARTLKWLALVLFAYVITALVVGPDWPAVLRDSFLPSLPRGREAWATLVAILGTTISPYLFFWQSSEEVEEEKGVGETLVADRKGASLRELKNRKLDVGIGTFFSNMVMFFIILTTALTLHRHGVTNPQSSREVAEALRPFGGRFTQILYTLGLVGVGFLAIPTLCGSAAYAFAETFRWKQGLDRGLKGAPAFYFIVVASTALGIALDFLKVNAVKALYWSAVINGLLAPFLLVGILVVASDSKVMNGQPISRLSSVIIGATAALMFAAAIGMFVL
jgi:NRAMP (natural resistance-associated macrophage protein)-like metal ion transporter